MSSTNGNGNGHYPKPKNVLGGELQSCCTDPITGFYRDGCCHTAEDDHGQHTVCAEMTEAFLAFSRRQGNDLSTPVPEADFPGLRPGDRWCLCAARWIEAWREGVAPPVILNATNLSVLELVPLHVLEQHGTA